MTASAALGAAERVGFRGYAKLVAVAVIWGGTFIGGRLAVQTMDAWSAATLRFAFASVCLLVAAWSVESGLPRLGGRDLAGVAALGLTGIVAYNLFFFAGLARIPAGRAALIIALNPVMVTVISAMLSGYRIGAAQLLGVALSLFGAVVVITHGAIGEILALRLGTGEICILGCVASWVSYTLLNRWVLRRLSPLAAITYACLIGTGCLAVVAFAQGAAATVVTFSLASWSGVAFLGVLGTALAFIWYAEGVAAIGPERAAVFLNLVPFSAVVLAALMLGEPVSWDMAAGGAFVVSGLVLTSLRPPATS